MEYIRRYFMALVICRRYGIKFKPYWFRFHGQYSLHGYLRANIFDVYFYETFFHELGHAIDFKRYPVESVVRYGHNRRLVYKPKKAECAPYALLERELRASRYASRALESTGLIKKGSKVMLRKALNTYMLHIPVESVADVVYNAHKYIRCLKDIGEYE